MRDVSNTLLTLLLVIVVLVPLPFLAGWLAEMALYRWSQSTPRTRAGRKEQA